MMNRDTRTVRYDEDLGLEAYRFQGITQPFPNHFHSYCVIGHVEAGLRRLFCKNREYIIKPGNILLFNPRDNHRCTQRGGETLDYREINIPADAMLRLSGEITGQRKPRQFSQNVTAGQDAALCLKTLPLGVIVNTAAILGFTLGMKLPGIVGPDVTDCAGRAGNHPFSRAGPEGHRRTPAFSPRQAAFRRICRSDRG